MDALKMSAVDRPTAARGSDHVAELESDEICLAPRMRAALTALAEALEYAQDLGASAWDFAIEISGMRRLKLSHSDLRWLVVRGFVEHAIDVTPRHDSKRSFRQPQRLLFGKKSCFVLSPAGAALVRELRGDDGPLENGKSRAAVHRTALDLVSPVPSAPKWDRDRQELRIGAIVVKRFTIPSASQETILAAFEEKDWPERIDDPLPPRDELSRKARLRETINLLNRKQKRPLLRFLGDGSGQGILWEFCADHAAPADHC